MKRSLYYLLPLWLVCILLPLPELFLWWRPDDGRATPMALFFVGCASLVAYAFRKDINPGENCEIERPELLWDERMRTVGTALVLASLLFSMIWLTLIDTRDFVAVFLACSIMIPSVCIVPCLTLFTRKPFAGVLFALFAVLLTKCLAGAVVVTVYGWHASEHVPPYTDLPWEDPNLHVWVFLLNTTVLCIWTYLLGKRKFRDVYERAASQRVKQAA